MKKLILLSLLALLVLNCGEILEKRIDPLFSDYTGDVPGAAVFVIRDGAPVFGKTYGLAHMESDTPVAFRSNFRLASVTKQFTAMCILMLIEEGKIDFDTRLTDIYPDYPAYGREISIEHLLRHTSGLVDYESLLDEADTTQVLDHDVLRMMMAQDSTYFPPGERHEYSNSGYAVLAMIIEKLSGLSFADYLERNIFDPLGMKNSVAWEKGISTVPFRAFGYADGDSAFVFSDQSNTSAVLGDGGIYSSILDLFKWDQALYTERLISHDLLTRSFIRGKDSSGEKFDYGFGWRLEDYKGLRCVYHTGSTCGFRNILKRYPDLRFTVILLTNRAEPDVKQIADQLTDIFLAKELRE
ncbi:MAG: serine hydrolase domain-containing protein [candidate division KSB1 bacterium]|jgi:CubicO group peptidase (beta-lactamase class C family)|nr:serine hydrolase domain-containing protein [candidate division KSB1 bacterium]